MTRITTLTQPTRDQLLYDEYLVTNGLGGYASGTLSGVPTRRYHSLLNAALPTPYGRTNMLDYIADSIILGDGREIKLSLLRQVHTQEIGSLPLKEFVLENGLPVWVYEGQGFVLEKKITMVHRQNSVVITYQVVSATEKLQIKWRPFFHFRVQHAEVASPVSHEEYRLHTRENQLEISHASFPSLHIHNDGKPTFTLENASIEDVFYELESRRGYNPIGHLISPGYYLLALSPGESTCFTASTEPWENIFAMNASETALAERLRRRTILKRGGPLANSSFGAKLLLAADQFIFTPTSRPSDILRLNAAGEEPYSIIAGYPWFTDWGRDTMISLEGLMITTGRPQIAYSTLRTFAFYLREGLIPNMFPEGQAEAAYNTADATLWFFHALDRYITTTGDIEVLELFLPKLKEIIDFHKQGTAFGIHMDTDGLLVQGREGLQLTWMDAKVQDWVVTPRRGKAVEINALWYNALKLLESWTNKDDPDAQKCYDSFNTRFWFAEGGYLYDVVDGEHSENDCALRPNQLFAIGLKFPVLEQSRWQPVLETVRQHLLTPFGLRTLAPSHPDFKCNYDGDLRGRDAAYHQGTVWPWLLGIFIDVWLKVHPDRVQEALNLLKPLEEHMDQHCIGNISEIFDATAPHQARGCFAQAWSVAEVLRAFAKLQGLKP